MICKPKADLFHVRNGHITHRNEGWIDDGLKINNEHFVYGIGVYKGTVKILIDPSDDCRPVWYSISDFDVLDNHFGHDVYTVIDDTSDDWTMIIGYNLLVESEDHFNGILERYELPLKEFADVKRSLLKEGI